MLFLCVAPYFIYKRKVPDVESHLRRWLPAYSVAIGGFSIFMFMAVKYVHLFPTLMVNSTQWWILGFPLEQIYHSVLEDSLTRSDISANFQNKTYWEKCP